MPNADRGRDWSAVMVTREITVGRCKEIGTKNVSVIIVIKYKTKEDQVYHRKKRDGMLIYITRC